MNTSSNITIVPLESDRNIARNFAFPPACETKARLETEAALRPIPLTEKYHEPQPAPNDDERFHGTSTYTTANMNEDLPNFDLYYYYILNQAGKWPQLEILNEFLSNQHRSYRHRARASSMSSEGDFESESLRGMPLANSMRVAVCKIGCGGSGKGEVKNSSYQEADDAGDLYRFLKGELQNSPSDGLRPRSVGVAATSQQPLRLVLIESLSGNMIKALGTLLPSINPNFFANHLAGRGKHVWRSPEFERQSLPSEEALNPFFHVDYATLGNSAYAASNFSASGHENGSEVGGDYIDFDDSTLSDVSEQMGFRTVKARFSILIDDFGSRYGAVGICLFDPPPPDPPFIARNISPPDMFEPEVHEYTRRRTSFERGDTSLFDFFLASLGSSTFSPASPSNFFNLTYPLFRIAISKSHTVISATKRALDALERSGAFKAPERVFVEIRRKLRLHTQMVETTLETIRAQGTPAWQIHETPTYHMQQQQLDLSTRANLLERDCERVLTSIRRLAERSNENLSHAMATTSIKESRRAFSNSVSTGRLTMMAFLFIPLSFLTSYFGMNVRQFGGGGGGASDAGEGNVHSPDPPSVYLFWALAIPLVLFTLMIYRSLDQLESLLRNVVVAGRLLWYIKMRRVNCSVKVGGGRQFGRWPRELIIVGNGRGHAGRRWEVLRIVRYVWRYRPEWVVLGDKMAGGEEEGFVG